MLIAKDIHKIYTNGKKELAVLKGVEFSIEKGRLSAIVGPSGAGKSTLLHILGGLDNPTRGKVFLEEEDLYSLSDQRLARIRNQRIGFVFQFYHLLSEFTVLENIVMPVLISRENARIEEDKLKQEALQLLEQVGLRGRADYFPAQLSGGEKQRVAIIRGLMNKPELLLCDEPTGNLDSQSGEEVISLLKKINAQNRMSIVLVTHNLELAKICEKVYYLKDGILAN